MPSHRPEVQFESCKSKKKFATEKLTDALGWKKVRTQATKHLNEAIFFYFRTWAYQHSQIERWQRPFGSCNDLEEQGCAYQVLLNTHVIFIKRLGKILFPRLPTMKKMTIWRQHRSPSSSSAHATLQAECTDAILWWTSWLLCFQTTTNPSLPCSGFTVWVDPNVMFTRAEAYICLSLKKVS